MEHGNNTWLLIHLMYIYCFSNLHVFRILLIKENNMHETSKLTDMLKHSIRLPVFHQTSEHVTSTQCTDPVMPRLVFPFKASKRDCMNFLNTNWHRSKQWMKMPISHQKIPKVSGERIPPLTKKVFMTPYTCFFNSSNKDEQIHLVKNKS